MSGRWSHALHDGNRSPGVVLEFLKEHAPDGFTVAEISGRMGISDSTVYDALVKLRADGVVTSTKSSRRNRPLLWRFSS